MAPLTTFLGRSGERDRLVDLLDGAPLVTVTGPGGIGNTRLVAEVARQVADRFAGGVVTGDLTPLPAGAGVQDVSGQLGFASPEAAAVQLAATPALVVLDNCEHVLDAVALFLSRLLTGDDPFRVVATSREPVGIDGEQVLVHPSSGATSRTPSGPGQGIGSALLADGLARCDREGVPAYLEATTLRNRALYERHGFVNTGIMAPAGGPTLWAMWREPAGS